MPIGPGKYDHEATLVRMHTRAEAVVVLVLNGERGTGLSVQGPRHVVADLADLLDFMAGEIRKSTEGRSTE